ncbi:hypothetical protein Dform_00347 [Dehalogenimonas formicexedens]|uniref:DUF2795 domain-containing protein n=1 Tax=Dehalogenimonas formicexedens TaxID=1839801 RepID=A0A1P8F5E5_9CHLR|nr:DUF2795 domain-containing protein [Dehalogenimonas formicexedens]APV43707.1 hypothetical protein Dform_00347 [Dehalogenimonas formicexedens]
MTMVMERRHALETKCHEKADYSRLEMREIEKSLRGMNYPATQTELIRKALMNHADNDVLAFLKMLPKGNFREFDDIEYFGWSLLVV